MKKVTLECFTSNAGIHELFPISPAKKYIPEWFKDIPPTLKKTNDYGIEVDVATLKRCDGLTKLYNNGWMIPLWNDITIQTNADGRFRYSNVHDGFLGEADVFGGSTIESHFGEQMGNQFDDYVHMKLIVPWFFREKTAVNFYYSGNTWGLKEYWNDLIIVPGILNFKEQHNAHINMFVKKGKLIELVHNTPLIHCVPLASVKLEIKNILATDQEYKHLKQSAFAFSRIGTYKKRLKLKCPVGKW